MSSYSKLKFYNVFDDDIDVILEPWGEEFVLENKKYVEIEYTSGKVLEIEFDKKTIVIHGELDTEIRLKINNEIVIKKLTADDFTKK